MWKGKDQTTIYSNFIQIHRGPKNGQTVTRPFMEIWRKIAKLHTHVSFHKNVNEKMFSITILMQIFMSFMKGN